MKLIKRLVLFVLVAVAGLVAYAFTQPDHFTVQRSVVVNAPAAKVFPWLSDLEKFNAWNPFLAADPASKLTYGAKKAGVGATYAWAGDKSGEGSMTITEVSEPSNVKVRLDFLKPMAATNAVNFLLEPLAGGQQTKVSWVMNGAAPLLSRIMFIFFDIDKEVGGEFAKGLATLKAKVEAP